MVITLAYLRRRFDEFNKLIFNESLPTPRLRVSYSRTMLGCVRYKCKHEGWLKKQVTYYDFTLSISAYYELDEEEIDDTILHEMIHLDILANQQQDDSAHGPLFRSRMKRINSQFGRHITISHRGKLTQAEQKRMQNIIAVSIMENGNWGVTRVSPSKVFLIHRGLPAYYHLKTTRWYNTTNPFFNSLPRSLTPKIYHTDKETMEKELQGAIELEFAISPNGKEILRPIK